MQTGTRYQKLRPFKKGKRYRVGVYVGKVGRCFIFKSGQKVDGLALANIIADHEEDMIDELLGKKQLDFKPKTFFGWINKLW